MPRRAPVEVQLATRAAAVPRGTDFAGWVSATLDAAGMDAAGTITVRLVGWREGRRLNENFRGKAAATNVLAFPASCSGHAGDMERQLGDIAICLPLLCREAAAQGKAPLSHLAHLVVHGVLHLLGHDHQKDAAARRMERMEKKILRRLGFADPYAPAGTRARAPARRSHKS
jgi:probable rRNA maturation factor